MQTVTLQNMPYQRPDVGETLAAYAAVCARIAAAQNAQAQLEAFSDFEQRDRSLTTMATLASIRHTIDTRDAFYEGENEFYDENAPKLSDAALNVYRALLASPFRTQLETALGALTLEKMAVAVKASCPEILALMAQENTLTTAYEKLYASAQIEFDGRLNTVSQMSLYKQSPNRTVRKAAYEAEGAWFDAHAQELDDLYGKLVQNRTQQAREMGYDNFIELGAIRLHRVGYTLADMEAYRAQIKADVVPVVAKLKQVQAARAGVEQPKYYDDSFSFPDGNPTPYGTPDEILAAGRTMYEALSPETASFIEQMFAADLFDVLSKPGKSPGGYCTYLPDYKLPFIFSNFNATSDDVDVLTHEAGHAFAAYVAGQKNLPSILEEPGMESCEIHSMAMEFLTADYHKLFFGADTAKYELAHAEEAMFFLPYGTMVDEFQHIMYANPDMTPANRHAVWAKLEREYRPWIDFDALPFYGRGAGWQRQLHIYELPFYYLDYCLAQTVALQFFLTHEKAPADAWQRYLALVNAAGTKTYPGLVAAAGFHSPFTPGTLQTIAQNVGVWIAQKNKELAQGK